MCWKCDEVNRNMAKCSSMPELLASQRRLDLIGQSSRQYEAGTQRVYSRKGICTPMWQPRINRKERPPRYNYVPSAAAVSFTYAFEQYKHASVLRSANDRSSFSSASDVYNQIRPSLGFQPHNFSYNLFW